MLHISLPLKQLLAEHPIVLVSPQLPLPLPLSCPLGWQAQTKPLLPSPRHQANLAWQPDTSTAGFWQKLPASDPDSIPGFLTAGCTEAACSGQVVSGTAQLPAAITVCLSGTALTAVAPRSPKPNALKALSLGLLVESGFPKAPYFWGPQNDAKIPTFFGKK